MAAKNTFIKQIERFFVRKTPKTCGIIDVGRLIHNTTIHSFGCVHTHIK